MDSDSGSGPGFDAGPRFDAGQGLADLEPQPVAPKRRSPVLAIVVVLVAAVGGVVALTQSGGGHAKSPTVVVAQASHLTTAAGSAHIVEVGTVTLNGRSSSLIHAEGDTEFGSKRGRLTMTIGAITQEMRSIDGVAYLSVPAAGPLPHGTHWVSFSPTDATRSADAARALGNRDPSSGLAYLSAANGDPRIVDHTTQDGVAVTHYAFTLDMKSLFDTVGKAADSQGIDNVRRMLQQLAAYVDLTHVPGEAWIDGDGRVRRFDFTFAVDQNGESAKIVMDVTFSKFGEAVDVQAPDASDTVSFHDDPTFFTDLAKNLKKTTTG